MMIEAVVSQVLPCQGYFLRDANSHMQPFFHILTNIITTEIGDNVGISASTSRVPLHLADCTVNRIERLSRRPWSRSLSARF